MKIELQVEKLYDKYFTQALSSPSAPHVYRAPGRHRASLGQHRAEDHVSCGGGAAHSHGCLLAGWASDSA